MAIFSPGLPTSCWTMVWPWSGRQRARRVAFRPAFDLAELGDDDLGIEPVLQHIGQHPGELPAIGLADADAVDHRHASGPG